MCSYRFGAVRVTIAMNGICRYHGVVKGPKTLFRALSIRQARYMIDAALPADDDYSHLIEDYSHLAPPTEGELLEGGWQTRSHASREASEAFQRHDGRVDH